MEPKKILRKLKKNLAKTSLHVPLLEIGALLINIRIWMANVGVNHTVYILSPYKTGTTYFASLWNAQTTKHEPCHLYSLKLLPRNFKKKFEKRASYLSLKVECSGYLSMYLEQLPKKTTQEYIYILREPSKWVGSVLSHFDSIKNLGYNYIDKFYWTQFLGYSMTDTLKRKDEKELKTLVYDLYDMYFRLLKSAIKNSDILFVKLENLDVLAESLSKSLKETPNFQRSWKRKSKATFHYTDFNQSDKDQQYEDLIGTIPKGRFIA